MAVAKATSLGLVGRLVKLPQKEVRYFAAGTTLGRVRGVAFRHALLRPRDHKNRWEYLHSPFHAAAYALDPSNLNVVKDIDGHVQKGLFLVFERLCIRDVMLQKNVDVSSAEKIKEAACLYTGSHNAVIKRVAQVEREFALYQQGQSPFNSSSAKYNATLMTPASWWELYGAHVPMLQGIAKRVLAQVASAFAAERNWSVYGQVKSERKLRLTHGHADARVYCHEALQLHEKLLKVATDEHEFVGFSDSDDSDADSNACADDQDEIPLTALMR
ncbi:hypothetical protein AB1Y20_011502 [Prymnesium parvum]|uniref:HAT C-terminal dimerisation domain-containing protein n=1 Tax=Prymnesium parvum TaxID=97485 RepID=A0AB34IGM3_PRYPA